MRDDSFEWDDDKAAANLARHGVPFEAARALFDDPLLLDWHDDRFECDEERFVAIGMAYGRLLAVVYVMRDDRIRIVSLRGAEPAEGRAYHRD
ncbi:MAG: BrnT family toxin [Pseudomonadota bacterium]